MHDAPDIRAKERDARDGHVVGGEVEKPEHHSSVSNCTFVPVKQVNCLPRERAAYPRLLLA